MNKKQSDRKEQILLDLVAEYIECAEPVSSGYMLDKYKYPLSSATIRNIMAELDGAGFLYQPHTSAGRVPTPKAYRFFVDKVDLGLREPVQRKETKPKKRTLPDTFRRELRDAIHESPNDASRLLSHYMAEVTNSLAFAGIVGINQFYREGLSRLLEEPEFISADSIRELISYTDSLENRLEKLYESIQDDIQVYIGAEEDYHRTSPFSLMAFTAKLPASTRSGGGPNEQHGVFGIVGPMRMRYWDNLELLNEVREIFEND